MAKADLPTGRVTSTGQLFSDTEEFFDRARHVAQDIDSGTYEAPDSQPATKKSIMAGLDSMWSRAKKLVISDSEADHAPLADPNSLVAHDETIDAAEKEARRQWKEANPNDTIHKYLKLFRSGKISQLPWHDDNNITSEIRGFGSVFPADSVKGDMFLKVDQIPSVLYKFNGASWIQVDKTLSDQHEYNDAYIDHLIEKISTGEYDPELLSDAERDGIEQRLQSKSSKA
jgi:hypothetical protein